jgi:hypothetical protein
MRSGGAQLLARLGNPHISRSFLRERFRGTGLAALGADVAEGRDMQSGDLRGEAAL